MGQQGICEIFHKVGSGLPTKRFAATFPPMKHTILAFLALGVGLANAADENKKAVDLKAGDFTFKVAAPWKKEKPSSRMVAGQLSHEKGKDVVTKFYFFGAGQGGAVDANVKRWIGQFQGTPEVETTKVKYGKTKVTFVFAEGTYLDGPPFGQKTPKADYALYGAILEGSSAPVFIKSTGRKKSMEALKKEFKKLAGTPFPGKKPVEVDE